MSTRTKNNQHRLSIESQNHKKNWINQATNCSKNTNAAIKQKSPIIHSNPLNITDAAFWAKQIIKNEQKPM